MGKQITDKLYDSLGRTICEIHREMYDILYDTLEGDERKQVLGLLDEAYGMAKKMDAKLRQYKNNWDDDWYEKEREEVIKDKLETRKRQGRGTKQREEEVWK